MEKDFDKWNNIKKEIHSAGSAKLYAKRDIWWIAFGVNVGFEQDGTSDTGERPGLVLKGFSPDVCLVLPLTTSAKRDKYYIDAGMVDGRKAAAIVSQIRLVDTRRFINKIGVIEKNMFEDIRKAVKSLI